MQSYRRWPTVPRLIIGTIAAVLVLSLPGTAVAKAEGPVGIGIIAGEPTGISGKVWLTGRQAVDMAAAWSFIDEGAMHLHADYLWHFFDRLEVESGWLPLYVGVGGRVKFGDDDEFLGVRVPFGIEYLFEDAPVDFFFEVAPLLDLAPETELRVNGAFGVRYFFL